MKPYTVEIEIDLPRDRVIELFDNPDNLCETGRDIRDEAG